MKPAKFVECSFNYSNANDHAQELDESRATILDE